MAVLGAVLGTISTAHAQSSGSEASPDSGHILLVLPFDNLTGSQTGPSSTAPATGQDTSPVANSGANSANEQSNLDWLREAAPEVLNSRFTSAGFLPLTREDRLYALDHLGLPETFQPSRATALRIAQTLDANYILIGSYSVTGTTLTLKARIVDVAKLRISEDITQSGPIAQLIPLLNSLAWQLTRKLDPSFNVAEETFRAAGAGVRLDAFEQYIRGITERDPQERLRHLKKATELSPDFSTAWLATGKQQFAGQQYEQAAVSFSKVAHSDPAELEAGFYRGLSLIFSGNYPRAEEAFASVARVLPLPEVVNNEAVAISRRGHDAIALFRQAGAADPTDPDYHFNLAVSLHSHGNKTEALTELAQSLKLRPNDSEAKAAEAAWKSSPERSQAANPIERIKRSYNGAAFRQAALMLDQVEAAHLATISPAERAARLSKSAREKLNRGLLLEAERGFQAALAADPDNTDAKTGLTQVRERAGTIESTQK
jgi:tetratricopeptide (TPR) repeat protein